MFCAFRNGNEKRTKETKVSCQNFAFTNRRMFCILTPRMFDVSFSKKHTVSICRAIVTSQHHHFGPEDGDSMFLRNVCIYLRTYIAPNPRTSSSSPPWEPPISQNWLTFNNFLQTSWINVWRLSFTLFMFWNKHLYLKCEIYCYIQSGLGLDLTIRNSSD
jgi:hypothetical protein